MSAPWPTSGYYAACSAVGSLEELLGNPERETWDAEERIRRARIVVVDELRVALELDAAEVGP